MNNMLDKNGSELAGGARWLREISLDGGMDAHNKKVAMDFASKFYDANPYVSELDVNREAEKRRKNMRAI